MQSGVLEVARSLYASIEQHYADIVAQMLFSCNHPLYEIVRDHYIAGKLKSIEDAADHLQDLFAEGEDLVSLPQEEITLTNANRDFEAAVARQREYNRVHKLPPWKEGTIDSVAADSHQMFALVQFSNTERFGRCLDLGAFFHLYVDFMIKSANAMPKGRPLEERLPMIHYTRSIATVHREISGHRKMVAVDTYESYASQLLEYLMGFYGRIKPLKMATLHVALRAADENFEEAWRTSKVPSWKELRSNEKAKSIAKCESRIEQVLSLLPDIIETTTFSLQHQLSRTPEEIVRELELEEVAFHEAFRKALAESSKAAPQTTIATVDDYHSFSMDEYEKSEQVKFANAKNVPLDSEGNPIAMWLFKLHQLDKKYSCQVCGGEVYRGPKVFNEHFREVRHTEGLARLGIHGNLEQYHLITSCAEALKRKRELDLVLSRKRLRSGEEEVEDPLGVVMTQRSINEYRKNFGRRL